MLHSLGPQQISSRPSVSKLQKGHFLARPAIQSFPQQNLPRNTSTGARDRTGVLPAASAGVQRSDSPSRLRTGIVSAPATAPTLSQHPDAIRRRQEAEERKQKRQRFTEATAAGCGWWEFDNPTNMHMVASPNEFRDRIQLAKRSNSLVVADYFAPWCNACKALHPKLQQLARNNPEVTFLSVNAGDQALNKLCEEVGVTQLPYFHFLKGEAGLVAEFSANLTAQKLQQIRATIMLHKGGATVN